MDTVDSDTQTTRRITRRDVIKRGAVIGGVVWAAPVIDTILSSPASAASAVHYCCFCFTGLATDGSNCGNVVNSGDSNNTDNGLADGHPITAQACACLCGSFGYSQYQWAGPSPNSYTLVTGTSGNTHPPSPVCGCTQAPGTAVITTAGFTATDCPPV